MGKCREDDRDEARDEGDDDAWDELEELREPVEAGPLNLLVCASNAFVKSCCTLQAK